MSIHVPDLGTICVIYGEVAPEITARLPKDAEAPRAGERITLTNGRTLYNENQATAECEAEVIAVAVIVRPDWSTFRNPKAQRDQGSLL